MIWGFYSLAWLGPLVVAGHGHRSLLGVSFVGPV